MLARLKLLVFLLPILIYLSGCGFSGNESDFSSSTTIDTNTWYRLTNKYIGTSKALDTSSNNSTYMSATA